MIDPARPLPLYRQVEAELRRLLRSGKTPPGAMLPSEAELCRRFGVSRHTLRMAVGKLEDDRLIKRTAGRGTLVLDAAPRRRFYLDQSFTQQMADLGRKAASVVLLSEVGPATEEECAAADLAPGVAVFRLKRVRLGDGAPVGVQRLILPAEACPGIETVDFSAHSVYEVLASRFGIVVGAIRHTVSATLADAPTAALLEAPVGSPLLAVRTWTGSRRGALIECTSSLYRADQFEFSTTHHPPDAQRP